MQQILAVEQHKEQPDDKRACNIDQKSRQRESAVVMLIDAEGRQIAREGACSAAGEDKKASNQQTPDFSAGTAKISAWRVRG